MSEISRRSLMTTLTAGSGLAAAAATGLVRPARAQEMMGRVVDMDAYTFMLQDPRLSIWVQLINAGGAVDAARTAIYTVFPAANSAFDQFPGLAESLVGYLMTTGARNAQNVFPDTTRIVALLRSHVIAGKHFTSEVMGKRVTLTTIAGTELDVDATDPNAVTIHWVSAANGLPLTATLAEPPVTTINAVIYVVDKINKM